MRSTLLAHMTYPPAIVRRGYQTPLLSRGRSIYDIHHRCPLMMEIERRYNSHSSSGDINGGKGLDPTSPSTVTSPVIRKNTRQRHRFHKNKESNISIDDIPSFHDFQRLMQIRSLYRQYTRLIGLYNRNRKNAASTLTHPQQVELQHQVRTEFKHHQNTNHKKDVFYIQKSLAEGQRRYKELYAMIDGTTTNATTTKTTDSNISNTTTTMSSSPTKNSATMAPSTSSSPPPATESYWPWNKTGNNTMPQPPTPSDESFLPLKFPPKSNL